MTEASCRIEIDGVSLQFGDSGDGETIVFVHGAYVTGAVWSEVTRSLARNRRCITPTWLFGAQRCSVGVSAGLDVRTSGDRIGRFLEVLDLHDVTLVANDTGGGIVLSALSEPPAGFERISRLVFTNCDTFEKFPPPNFAPVVGLCRVSKRAGAAVMWLLATRVGQRFFASAVTRNGIDPKQRPAIFGGFITSAAVRREAVTFSAGLNSHHTMAAAEHLKKWTKPVLAVWGEDDKILTIADARRLVGAFPDSRLITVPDASTFVMVDRPDRVAGAIEDFTSG